MSQPVEEERDMPVTLTLRLSTIISFASMERAGPITNADAIANAIGSLPVGWLETAESEGFAIAYPIEGEVTGEDI